MKYIIWGLGAVGLSFLNHLKANGYFDPSLFYCVDYREEAQNDFLNAGGLDSHFTLMKITKENINLFFSKLDRGDFLFDFTIDVKNLDVLRFCLSHGIHYLSTADSSWNPDPTWMSDHQHYLEYLSIKTSTQPNLPTCVIEFGMNPGMVSCFAKKCLEEIVTKDQSLFIRFRRKKLLRLLSFKKYGLVCKKIGVTDVQEVDNDDQKTNIPYELDVCYSPWNVWGYYYETVSSPEIAFGSRRAFFGYKNIYDYDEKDLYLGLGKAGFEYLSKTISPQGKCTGHISTHEEVFSIRKMFTHGKYRPNVHFVYSPCDFATESVRQFKNKIPHKLHMIRKNEIDSGGESVGIIIQGKHFKTRYFGNYLRTAELKETATILQASASAYSAFVYMTKHQNSGLLFPEELDSNEVLQTALPYLKEYQTIECQKINMYLGKDSD